MMIDEVKKNNLQWDRHSDFHKKKTQIHLNSFRYTAWKDLILANAPDKQCLDILDSGTGPGFFLVVLGQAGHNMTGIDISEKMLEYSAENTREYRVPCDLYQMDAGKLSFSDESFDLIVSRNVTYALPDPQAAYSEWYRVLRPNGKLLIFDANWYHFLFNNKLRKKIEDFLPEYHKKTGIMEHEAYEYEVKMFNDHIMTRPLTRCNRPNWDCEFLQKIGFKGVFADETIGKKVDSEEEQYQFCCTPLFMISACKS